MAVVDPKLDLSYKESVATAQEPFYAELGKRLRRARKMAGCSQARLANYVGMSRSSIANIESGRQPIYVRALVQIARQLETSVESLIPSQKRGGEIDSRTTHKMNQLPETQRHFVNLILQMSTAGHKEIDGSQIRSSKKASRRSSKTGSRQKGTRAG